MFNIHDISGHIRAYEISYCVYISFCGKKYIKSSQNIGKRFLFCSFSMPRAWTIKYVMNIASSDIFCFEYIFPTHFSKTPYFYWLFFFILFALTFCAYDYHRCKTERKLCGIYYHLLVGRNWGMCFQVQSIRFSILENLFRDFIILFSSMYI